jgi:serine phosphatase RsbU (regulator of sigma subunit)
MAGDRQGGGIPLSVKMILTVALLLAAAVAASAWAGLRTVLALADREAAARRTAGDAEVDRESRTIVRTLGISAGLPLSEYASDYIKTLVDETVKADGRIEWLVIAHENGAIDARSPNAPPGEKLDDAMVKQVAATPGEIVATPDPSVPYRIVFGVATLVHDHVVGQIRLAVSTSALEKEIARSVEEAHAEAKAAVRGELIVAGIILLLGILIGALQAHRIARPIRDLSAQAHRIAEGDLSSRVQINSRDEIGRLGDDFNYMADQLRALLAETANRASLEREMSLAREVQESMIPPRALLSHGPFFVMGHCEPATACGGDWWTLRKLSGDRLLLVVGDVTGHGIPSAMVAATARGAVEALAALDEGLMTPAHVLRAIDKAIRGVGTSQLLMTCFAALIDPDRGVVEYSNAGHNFPYMLHVDRSGELNEISVLALRGSPLGQTGGELTLDSGTRKLKAGDVFVFFTDGVIDRVDGSGNRFGDRRLRHMLLHRHMGVSGQGLEVLQNEIIGKMQAFANGFPADDDVTLVLCQFDPPTAAQAEPKKAVS